MAPAKDAFYLRTWQWQWQKDQEKKKMRKYSKRNATNFALVCPKREK
jgi:hypothetical protein